MIDQLSNDFWPKKLILTRAMSLQQILYLFHASKSLLIIGRVIFALSQTFSSHFPYLISSSFLVQF